MDKTVVLITLHGGGFVEGDSTWDGPQTALLMNMNCYVYQLDFVKTTLEECLRSIRTKVQNLARVHKLPFYVLGRSSGGYLAKVLYDMHICKSDLSGTGIQPRAARNTAAIAR